MIAAGLAALATPQCDQQTGQIEPDLLNGAVRKGVGQGSEGHGKPGSLGPRTKTIVDNQSTREFVDLDGSPS